MPVEDAAAQMRLRLFGNLEHRREEIEQAVLARVEAIQDPAGPVDPEYADGFAVAVAASIGYGLAGLAGSDKARPPIPVSSLSQVRLAAREGISLATVIRRYLAGSLTLVDFVLGEAEDDGSLDDLNLKSLLRIATPLLDRLIAAVAEEYEREAESSVVTSRGRQAELVERALAGEMIDPDEISYDFDGWNIAAVVKGPYVLSSLRQHARMVDRRLLLVRSPADSAWIWLGGRRPFDKEEMRLVYGCPLPSKSNVAWGEPGFGPTGWRLSHQQARAALPVGLRTAQSPVRYAEVSLLAAMLQDRVLRRSIRQLYLDRLEDGTDHGQKLRNALRAYVDANGSISSAAAALGVNRKTMASRIATAETLLGRPMNSCMAEIDAALKMEGIEKNPPTGRVDTVRA